MRFIFLFSFLLTTGIFAKEWTLDELNTHVQDNNLDIQSEQQMILSLKSTVQVESNDVMPLRASYSLMDIDPEKTDFSIQNASHKITLNQELPITGRLGHQQKIASQNVIARSYALASLVNEKIYNLIKDAYDVSLTSKLMTNLSEQKLYLQQFFESARSQYAQGKLSLSTLSALEIKIADLDLDLIQLQQKKQELLWEIQELAAIQDPLFSIKEPALDLAEQNQEELSLQRLLSAYQTENPQRQYYQHTLLAQQSSVDLEKAKNLPDIGLMAEGTYTPRESRFQMALGIEVSLPVLGIGGTFAKITAAEKEQSAKEFNLLSFDLVMTKKIQRLVNAHQSNITQLNLINQRILRAGEDNFNHMLNEYKLQTSDLQSVIDAVSLTYESKKRILTLQAQDLGLLAELKALTGQKQFSPRSIP